MENIIKTFIDRHMRLIDGQQMLPAAIFRSFLEELTQLVEDIQSTVTVDDSTETMFVKANGKEYKVGVTTNAPSILPPEP